MPSLWLPSPHEVPPLLVDNENLYHLGTGLPTCYNSIAAEADEVSLPKLQEREQALIG